MAALPRKQNTSGHQPIVTKGFGERGQVHVPVAAMHEKYAPNSSPPPPQVDLIDFQSAPDGVYKFLLNYQDHGVKFYDCRALTHKTSAAVATALLDIFSGIGPPTILQADNGKEFSNIAGNGRNKVTSVSVDLSSQVCSADPNLSTGSVSSRTGSGLSRTGYGSTFPEPVLGIVQNRFWMTSQPVLARPFQNRFLF